MNNLKNTKLNNLWNVWENNNNHPYKFVVL